MNREFTLLAQTYKNQNIQGFLWSEKHDGVRCLWIPQLRGCRPSWQTNDIDATGLFSRYGNVFRAPDWFLDTLPTNRLLDGELIAGTFNETVSIVRSHNGDWSKVMFHIFDSPAPQVFATPGRVNNIHFKYTFTQNDRFDIQPVMDFQNIACEGEYHTTVIQQPIECVTDHLTEVTSKGGEGLMLRDPTLLWHPKRSNKLLKVKELAYGEGVITKVTKGLGKLEGMIGAVEVDNAFLISGFTNEERQDYEQFKPGKRIKYQYTGRTSAGHPRECRYCRTNE